MRELHEIVFGLCIGVFFSSEICLNDFLFYGPPLLLEVHSQHFSRFTFHTYSDMCFMCFPMCSLFMISMCSVVYCGVEFNVYIYLLVCRFRIFFSLCFSLHTCRTVLFH